MLPLSLGHRADVSGRALSHTNNLMQPHSSLIKGGGLFVCVLLKSLLADEGVQRGVPALALRGDRLCELL